MAKRKKKRNGLGTKFVLIFYAFAIFLLASNIVYLGTTGKHLISGDDIRAYAENRNTGQITETIQAKRGTIYSSDNQEIASDIKKYKMYAILSSTRINTDGTPAYVVDPEETAKQLSEIIDMPEEKLLEKLTKDTYQVEFGNYGNNLSSVVKEKIEALDLPGIEFESIVSRNYAFGDFASYAVGYTTLDSSNTVSYLVGQMGIEKSYNDTLSGTDGQRVYLADNKGYMLPNGLISQTDAVNGNDVYMTINSTIQTELDYQMSVLAEKMEVDVATCAVMNIKTGEILAISDYPSYDPNKKEIENYTDVFFNEAVEPGSVFKSFTYASAIEEGKLDVSNTYQSGKYEFKVNGKTIATIKDHNEGKGWGTITFEQGFYKSSNVAICNILEKYIKPKKFEQYIEDLGFFQDSEVDGIYSGSGVAGYSNATTNLELYTCGFGQGATMTGYQLLRAYSVFGNDGKMVDPYLVSKVVNPDTGEVIYKASTNYSKQIYSKSTCATVRKLLYGVINEQGTGKNYKMDDVELIGKTGTGQVAKNGAYMEDYYTHSFCGMAPYDDPQIEVVVWYQSYKSGTKVVANMIKSVVSVALNELYEETGQVVESSITKLPSYTNQSTSFTQSQLKSAGLDSIVIGDGKTVIDQYPKKNTKVKSNTRVFLLTNGENYTMPNMVGWSRKEAEIYANYIGMSIEASGTGTVTSQSIPVGTTINSQSNLKIKAN